MLKETKLHEHGFVRLLSVYGSDQDIEDAARISYGAGTRKVSDTRNLLRYLIRHKHTSPLEQACAKFHIKLPLFVMAQIVRHRTAKLNQASYRYSEAIDEFYTPENFAEQSKNNKQGSGDNHTYSDDWKISYNEYAEDGYRMYKDMIADGISKEQARYCLPVSGYTECVWLMDLHNLMHFLKLRTDSHAQKETRDYADAIEEMVKPYFPICVEAYNDYIKESITLSRMEILAMKDKLAGCLKSKDEYNMSDREWREFNETWN